MMTNYCSSPCMIGRSHNGGCGCLHAKRRTARPQHYFTRIPLGASAVGRLFIMPYAIAVLVAIGMTRVRAGGVPHFFSATGKID